MDAGEDDMIGAQRELEEELGLRGLELRHVVTAKYQPEDGSDNLYQNIYEIRDFDEDEDGGQKLVLQESEVERMERWALPEIQAKLDDA